MNTPIADFAAAYQGADFLRLHMPGHKGVSFLGCEGLDITEIHGADALYEADGIIAESEANAATLFGSGRTLFSTEGSSQCIRAMLALAVKNRPAGTKPVVVAARNAHKAFLYAAALLDFEIVWLWPHEGDSFCACTVTPEQLESVLRNLSYPPTAVYVTSPDYLGHMADIRGLAEVCHKNRTILAVDNAHGAYLHFLQEPCHPLDLGADLCCDSAHKTLPVLTGGAYLHLSKNLPNAYSDEAKRALGLFGSTSPSYLTLQSLDLCNRYLSEGYRTCLTRTVRHLEALKRNLRSDGWQAEQSDPLRLTLCCDALAVASRLRQMRIECEFADRDYLVLMVTPENGDGLFDRLPDALGKGTVHHVLAPPVLRGKQICTPRQAILAPQETVRIEEAFGRICGAPSVSCPPAIPVAVSGEEIGAEAIALFQYYGIERIAVLKQI